VHSTDCNITNDLICSLYNVFYRTVKVLPTGLGTVLKECKSTFEETSRAYLITNGKTSAFLKAVSGSVQIKRNISLSIVIQLISIVLGVLLTATLALYAGVGVLGTLEVLIYSMFWGVATLVAPLIHKT
jgi:P-type Cu+ transporter